jgi:hypothetical protein
LTNPVYESVEVQNPVPLGDQIGVKTAEGLVDVLGSIVTRIDPGAAPGVQIDEYGISHNLEEDALLRAGTHVEYVPHDDTEVYTYDSYDTVDNPVSDPTSFDPDFTFD